MVPQGRPIVNRSRLFPTVPEQYEVPDCRTVPVPIRGNSLGNSARTVLSPAASGPSPRLLNLRQAAVVLGVSFWSVRDYVLAGLLPTVSLPALRAREGDRQRQTLRRVLVDVEDLERFIAQHKTRAADVQSQAPQNEAKNTGEVQRSVPAVCPRRGRR